MNNIFAIVTFGGKAMFLSKEEYRNFMSTAVAHNLDVVDFTSYRVINNNLSDSQIANILFDCGQNQITIKNQMLVKFIYISENNLEGLRLYMAWEGLTH